MAMDRRGASAPMLVRDGVLALPNVPNVVLLANARVVLWDTVKRRANRLDLGDIRTLVSLLETGADKQKEDAAAVIANLACDRDNREAMASTDAVFLLVQILRVAQSKGHLGLNMLMLKSTRAISNLTWQNSNTQQQVDECDGIRVLVDLLGGVGRGSVDEELHDEAVTALNHIFDSEAVAGKADANAVGEQLNRLVQRGSETQRGHATWLLAKIACHTMRDTVPPAQLVDFPALVEMLSSESISHSMQAAAVLRRLSKDSENKSKIVVAGGVAPLIALLMRGSEKEKVDAAWTLGELAWNAFSESQIANAGAIPPLLALLQSDSVREREGAAWALRHLSGTTENRNRIGISLHGIHNLVNAVRTTDSTCERVHAIATLKNLACQSENQSAIAASGGIPVLLSVVKKGTQSSVTEALAALRNLVRLNQINQAQFVAGGGIVLMVGALLNGSETQRVHAVAMLANLAANKEMQFEIIAEGVLSCILPLTESDDFALLEQVLLLIRNLIWANESIQQRIGASGVIPRIAAALKLDVEGCQGVKKQAASALRNLAWHCPANQSRIEEAHGVVHLLRFLSARTGSGQREHAAGAIANLSWNNERVQEAVAMMKGLPVLTELAARASDKVQAQAKLALRQFVFQDDKKVRRAAPKVVDSLVRLLQSSSHAPSHQQASWMIANLACSADNKEDIVQSGAIRPLVGLLSNGDDRVKQYAASAIANLASSPEHKLQIIEAGSVPPLIELVAKGTDGQKKNSAWALRNLAWSCTDGQNAIAAANGIKPLIGLIGAGNDAQKDHAAAALGNVACNDANQVKIAATGGIEALVQLVFAGTDSQKQQAVWAIANLALAASNRSRITECGGIAALEYVLANGGSQQQRGAATALARLNDPGRLVHPLSVDSSHAVFRTLSEGSEDTLNMPPPQHVELARGGSLQSRASDTHALLSQQSPDEQQVGRALYRSIKSVPTIVTRSPTVSIEPMSPPNRSPTEQHRSDTAQFFKLQSVQEASDFKDENERIVIGAAMPPNDMSKLQLRHVQSSAPQKRVAYRMPPSPLEQSRLNRPLLPQPSTLGDLLDPLGGMTPPSNPAKLLRPVSHNKMKNGATTMNGKSSQQVESKPKTSLGLGQQQPPAVDLKDVRTLSLNEQEYGYFGRELIPGKENLPAKGSVLEELFRRSVGLDPGNDDQTSIIPSSHWNGRIPHQLRARKPSDLSSFEDIYEFDEDELAPPSTSTSSGRSKYPVVTL